MIFLKILQRSAFYDDFPKNLQRASFYDDYLLVSVAKGSHRQVLDKILYKRSPIKLLYKKFKMKMLHQKFQMKICQKNIFHRLGKPSNKKTVKIGDIVPFGQPPP